MTQTRSISAIDSTDGSYRETARQPWRDSLALIILLVVLAVSSAAAAIADPLSFGDIFSRL
jgi:hypothetical protein